MTEFLPLCDVLFNVISLAGYFCDVVFDVVLGYALFERGRSGYFAIVLCLVLSSLLVSQIVSLRWYWSEIQANANEDPPNPARNGSLNKKETCPSISYKRNAKFQRYTVVALHVVQLGVLWRYAKLFVPVDLRRVKHEVRDLCMLRLVHGFCEAAPMLLLQLYLLITIQTDSKFLINNSEMKLKSLSGHSIVGVLSQQPAAVQQQAERTFKDLNIVSAVLSLFSVCWALASFSKNVRLQNVHRLVLTWLGVIFQFLWRLGTVTSRIASLTVYASFYNYWVFLVIILHWFSMLLWLISPKNVFHGERISRLRKTLLSALIAFVYVFAYINLQEVNHRQKMITFYIVMFLENSLLVCLWMVGVWPIKPSQWYLVPILVIGAFALGMFFMVLYYRYFHVRRLGYEDGGRYPTSGNDTKTNQTGSKTICSRNVDQPPIAGVFNCRFTNPVGNGATKRKKKKPTTFIPPPTLGFTTQLNQETPATVNGPMPIPFWRRPLSQSQSSENESSVGSRVNIHQKLQEKKQKQLAELKIIEEEIKQGKLGGPATNTLGSGDDGRTSLPRQPIPRTKKHINLDPIEWCSSTNIDMDKRYNDLDEMNNLNKFTNQYDQLYSSFGLSGINIPALEQPNVKNISPNPSSQVSGAENNSLTRQVMPRTKMPHNGLRNPFTDNYRNVVSNQANALNQRNVTSSPVRTGMFDHLNHQSIFLEINHPRQISGTYSSSNENANPGMENLPFPYNVIPPPRSKLDSKSTPPTPSLVIQQQNQSTVANKLAQRQLQRAKTPEVLLAPHYLDNSRVYYDWVGREATYRIQESDRNQTFSSGDENLDISAADESIIAERNGNHAPSDIDSQVSLPRSYTLPREFKYYRRNKMRKFNKNEHFITSTNSSDGDVDSADDDSERHSDTSQCRMRLQHQNSRKIQNNFHNHPQPTTSNPISSHATSNPHQLRNNRNNFIASPINQSLCNNPPNDHLHPSDITVNNLDLINGVENNLNNNIFPTRQSRLKVYGANKHGMMPWRHETKL